MPATPPLADLLPPLLTHPFTPLLTRLSVYTLYRTLPLRTLLYTHLTRNPPGDLYASLPLRLTHRLLLSTLHTRLPHPRTRLLLRFLLTPLRTRAWLADLTLVRAPYTFTEFAAGVVVEAGVVVLERVGWERGGLAGVWEAWGMRGVVRGLVGELEPGVREVVWGEGEWYGRGMWRWWGVWVVERAVGYWVRRGVGWWEGRGEGGEEEDQEEERVFEL